MATLSISDSYSDRALVLVAALAGPLERLAISAAAGGSVQYVPAVGADAVTEPSVVVKALVAGTPLLPAHTSSASALVTQWLLWAFSPAATAADALSVLDSALASTSYVAGPRFTVADAVVYYQINPALHALGGGALKHANVARWLDQVLHERGIGGSTALGVPAVPAVAAAFKRAPLNLFAAPAAAAAAAAPAAKAVTAAAPASAAAAASKAKGKEEKPAAAAASGAAAVPAPAAAAVGGAGAPAAAAAAPAEKKEKPAKGEAKPKADAKGAAAAAEPAASAEPIAVCDLRVGHIVKVWPHPEAERLFCEEIDVGEGAPRQIASGLREHYKLEELQGRKVVVVCNLKPRPLVGFNSNGMVLAATSPAGKVELLEPPADAKAGERVTFEGMHAAAAEPNHMAKKKWFDLAAEHLKVDDALQASYKGVVMMTSAGPVKVPSAVGGTIH